MTESNINPELPPELRVVARDLDALGSAERGSAPEGLESRLFLASRGAFQAARPEVIAKIGARSALWKLRLAAAVGITGLGLASAYLMVGRPSSTAPATPVASSETLRTQLDSDMEQWMSEASVTSDELASVRSAIGSIGHGDTDPWEAVEWDTEGSSL